MRVHAILGIRAAGGRGIGAAGVLLADREERSEVGKPVSIVNSSGSFGCRAAKIAATAALRRRGDERPSDYSLR